MKKCKIRGCKTKSWARGYCSTHYSRLVVRAQNKKKACSISGCKRGVKNRDLCKGHYRNYLKYGSPLATEGTCVALKCIYPKYARSKYCLKHADQNLCSVTGCGKAHDTGGYCFLHFSRWRRTGDPLKKQRKDYGFRIDDKSLRKTNPVSFLWWSYNQALSRVRGTGSAGKTGAQYYKFDPIMTRDEWISLYSTDPEFLACYKNWQLSGFQRRMCPVPDHDTENGLGYTAKNIEWVPLYENSLRAIAKTNERRAA